MSHEVERSTYIDADERTTKALTYDMLTNLYRKLSDLIECQEKQITTCTKRFETLETRKRKDSAIAASGGILGGFVAMTMAYIKQWLS